MQATNLYTVGRGLDVLSLEPQTGMLYVAAEYGVHSAVRVDRFNIVRGVPVLLRDCRRESRYTG
jgi:hypothetical protein